MTANMFEPHYLMIDSGTFWRCAHGHTGFGPGLVLRPCWRCGLRHPIRFLLAVLSDG